MLLLIVTSIYLIIIILLLIIPIIYLIIIIKYQYQIMKQIRCDVHTVTVTRESVCVFPCFQIFRQRVSRIEHNKVLEFKSTQW